MSTEDKRLGQNRCPKCGRPSLASETCERCELSASAGSGSLGGFMEGLQARDHDDEHGALSDNPFTPGTVRFDNWYEGYNFYDRPECCWCAGTGKQMFRHGLVACRKCGGTGTSPNTQEEPRP